MAESLSFYRYYGLPVSAAMPRVFVALNFHLGAVIDLSDGSVRRQLRISEKALLSCDWRKPVPGELPLSQRIGQAAASAGIEGLRIRSAAAPDGENLVVFPENLQADSTIRVDRPEQLH